MPDRQSPPWISGLSNFCGPAPLSCSLSSWLSRVSTAGRFSAAVSCISVLGSALGGYLLRDFVLGLRIKRRESRMLSEFPSLAELMALAVAAGESAMGAMDRVSRSSNGELSGEFATILADARSGKPLTEALLAFSSRSELPPLVRFIDGLVVAVERGTPSGGCPPGASGGRPRRSTTGTHGVCRPKRDCHDGPARLWRAASDCGLRCFPCHCGPGNEPLAPLPPIRH